MPVICTWSPEIRLCAAGQVIREGVAPVAPDTLHPNAPAALNVRFCSRIMGAFAAVPVSTLAKAKTISVVNRFTRVMLLPFRLNVKSRSQAWQMPDPGLPANGPAFRGNQTPEPIAETLRRVYGC